MLCYARAMQLFSAAMAGSLCLLLGCASEPGGAGASSKGEAAATASDSGAASTCSTGLPGTDAEIAQSPRRVGPRAALLPRRGSRSASHRAPRWRTGLGQYAVCSPGAEARRGSARAARAAARGDSASPGVSAVGRAVDEELRPRRAGLPPVRRAHAAARDGHRATRHRPLLARTRRADRRAATRPRLAAHRTGRVRCCAEVQAPSSPARTLRVAPRPTRAHRPKVDRKTVRIAPKHALAAALATRDALRFGHIADPNHPQSPPQVIA